MTKRKITAFLLALAIAAPITTALADDPDPSATATTGPEVTVVGKRIIGDDTYFEISLEVNGDYEDYSAVGVVLEYDPDYIVPADSWDDEATEANMDDAVSWATRRALPTLGKDTWSTHTALTYIEQNEVEDPADSSKTIKVRGKGYLYLGAEYPGKQPNTATESSDGDGDGDGSSGDGTATDSTTPEVDPDNKYANPVVAVRFMYAGDDANAKKAAKAKLVSEWEKTQSGGKSWQDDWFMNSYENANAILRIAPDEISAKSPAQYGFAYYGADFSERAFMYDWPTATVAPVTPATRAPYTPPATGSAIAAENRLSADKIEIVTDEGKTAKSGGLQLSDVFAVLFFDWDDSLIGSITAGIGAKDMEQTVNDYVEERFIHPALREKNNGDGIVPVDYSTLTPAQLKDREYSYRGEFPYSGPDTANPTTPMTNAECIDNGADYPLTNKLEYSFAGKEIDIKHPFANGWTRVLTTDIDYQAANAAAIVSNPSATVPYPGDLPSVLPKSMGNTWTSLTKNETIARLPDFDSSGNPIDEDGNTITPTPKYPTLASYDFSNMKASDLNNGVLYVKAVYTPCNNLDYNSTPFYTLVDGSYDCTALVNPTAAACTYAITFQYKRINQYGYGVTRLKKPTIKMEYYQTGVTKNGILGVSIENNDVIDVELNPTKALDKMDYSLIEMYNANVESGIQKSTKSGFGSFVATNTKLTTKKNYDGFIQRGVFRRITELLYNNIYNRGAAVTLNVNITNDMGIKSTATGNGVAYTALNANTTAKTKIMNFIKAAFPAERANGLTDEEILRKITYYQLQYYILKNTYVQPDVARSFCEANYNWCK